MAAHPRIFGGGQVSEHRVERTGVGAWTVYGPSLEQPATLPNPNDAHRIAAALNAQAGVVEALQACLDYGAMTGAEWVEEKARAALAAIKGEWP
jgi:hypothetical protein